MQIALRDLRKLFAETLVDEFRPAALKTDRQELNRRDLARSTVNKQIVRMIMIFAWAVSESLLKLKL